MIRSELKAKLMSIPYIDIKYRMIKLVEKIKSAQIDSKPFKVYLRELKRLKKENPIAWLEIQ